jgi:hypothetical protein
VGEKQNQPFQFLFDASLKIDFQGSRVTSNGSLILVRELDERLGLEKLIEGRPIRDARYYWLLLAESHLTRRLFGSMLRRIAALPMPSG